METFKNYFLLSPQKSVKGSITNSYDIIMALLDMIGVASILPLWH